MENGIHNMNSLFAQLGRPCDELAIAAFIEAHAPLPGGIALHEAGFWSRSQADFLRESINDDADWAAVADDLNILLHGMEWPDRGNHGQSTQGD